jgi:hypothetical protein
MRYQLRLIVIDFAEMMMVMNRFVHLSPAPA